MTDKLLCELIALPSVNPAFLPAGNPLAGERSVAEFLVATAAQAGLAVELQEVSPDRPNALAVYTPTGKVQRRILLAPHMDTVGGTPKQFSPYKKGNRIYGRGACDTKGSVASMLSALIKLLQSSQRPAHTEIIFAGLIDEENVQAGSRALAKTGIKADLAIVGEPTTLKVVTAHKGDIWIEFKTHGKAAHGAQPELGCNAIHEMAKVVHLVETLYAEELRQKKHPFLGPGTISVGVIQGGIQPNIVPNHCRCLADRRTLPGETASAIKREIQALLKKHGLKANVSSVKQAPCHPMETKTSLPSVQNFLKIVGQTTPIGVNYFCDASVLSRSGIPSIVFGPGDIAQAHTEDEWVSQKSLDGATALLLNFLQAQP